MPFLETKNKRDFTFSLSYMPSSIVGGYEDVHLSESHSVITSREESLIKMKGKFTEDVNAPLCPLLPSVKRNKNNKLAMHLEKDDFSRTITQ